MAVIHGVISGVSVLSATKSGAGARKAYLVKVDFPAYTSSDSMDIAGVGAAIASRTAKGKTLTLVAALCSQPGADANGQAVYTGALTVSTDDLTGNLTDAEGNELSATSGVSKGVEVIAVVTES